MSRPSVQHLQVCPGVSRMMQSLAQLLTIGVAPVFTKTNKLDIVITCGSPGAGKSSYYWKYLQPLGYARVNQDILKTVRA
jgi:hypothetical protein